MDSGIRSCVRGLELLKALNAHNYATALELSRLTRLPRPTVYRLLGTLVESGFVSRDECTDVFYLTESVVALSRGFGPGARAIQLAKPRIKAFSDAICWPSFLHERVGEAMVTRAIVRSPRSFGYPRIGKQHPILASAPGRAFLSSLDAAERQDWVGGLPDAKRREIDALVRDARVLGCGFREGGLVPRTCSLSLPIRHEGRQVAYWTIVLMSSAYSVNRAIAAYLDGAKELAASIEGDLHPG